MSTFLETVRQARRENKDLVFVSVISSSGSTPGKAGAHMIVGAAGLLAGTIGGGSLEHHCVELAGQVLLHRCSLVREFSLNQSDSADLGMVCGGNLCVMFQFLSAQDPRINTLISRIQRLLSESVQSWLVTDLTAPLLQTGLYRAEGGFELISRCSDELRKSMTVAPHLCEAGGRTYYLEPLCTGERVLIFGGGHVAQKLVPVLSDVDFTCIVMDDRKEFVRKELFPQAEAALLVDFERLQETISVGKDDYVVIMTRGHQHDFAVEAQVLATPAFYIGVIGSARKTADVNKRLLAYGFSAERLRQVHAPIGIAIQAETPGEIAISIAGELIQLRAARRKP